MVLTDNPVFCDLPMKDGDLVDFRSSSWLFKHAEDRYSNPGIILNTSNANGSRKAEILWADGKITTESEAYISALSKE